VVFEVASYTTAADLVGNGLGVAFVPASAAVGLDGVAQVPIVSPGADSPALTWRIQIATAVGRRPSAAARAFLDELRYLLPR
jgi:DNA-binding transcriptional LysR family regulator